VMQEPGLKPGEVSQLRRCAMATVRLPWLYTPRGSAILYVPLRNQHLIRTTLPTSWGFIPSPDSPTTAPSLMRSSGSGKSAFEELFEFVATTDDTAYLCVPAALKFRSQVCGGEDRIYTYLEKLAMEAGNIVAAALGTEVMQEPGLKPGEVYLEKSDFEWLAGVLNELCNKLVKKFAEPKL
ncbi:hypothetical protein KXV26_005039, partial [Aspergillus fumigatus]